MLCQYFYKDFRPLIQLYINKEARDLDGWNTLIKKATQVEVKTKIQASASRNLNQQYYKGN